MIKIPGYSRYAVDSQGFLYSLNYKNSGRVKKIKAALDGGYLKTMILSDDGKYHTVRVHRIVALAYLGKCPDGKEINHKNGIKTDNRPNNLEYITHSENLKHAYENGLQKPMRGSKNGNSKLSEPDILSIREYVNNFKGRYYGRKALAEKYGVSEAHIKDIISGRRGIWSHIQ